jgi:hypothetical protein
MTQRVTAKRLARLRCVATFAPQPRSAAPPPLEANPWRPAREHGKADGEIDASTRGAGCDLVAGRAAVSDRAEG